MDAIIFGQTLLIQLARAAPNVLLLLVERTHEMWTLWL